MTTTGAAGRAFPISRKDFLRLSALLAMPRGLSLLGGCGVAGPGADGPVRIGYLPLTDAAPLLVAHARGLFDAEGIEAVKPIMFRGWSQIIEAFLAGQVNVVHMLSPVVIWARYGSRIPTKVVAWNHVDGSSLTVANDIGSLAELGGKTVAIPHWYSIHNAVLQELLRTHGLEVVTRARGVPGGVLGPRQVSLTIMAPADMLAALATGQIAGYIVAEPFNALAEANGVGRVLRFTGDVWRQHACCQVIMHEGDIDARPEWTQKVVNAIVKAELWLHENRGEAAQLLAATGPEKYTPHSSDVLARVLVPDEGLRAEYVASGAIRHPEWQEPRVAFQPYPYPSYTEELIRLLKDTKVEGDNSFLATLDPAATARDVVDDRFVRAALAGIGGFGAFGLPDSFTRKEELRP